MEESHEQSPAQSGTSAKSKTFSADDFVAKFREKLEEAVRKHPVFCKEVAYLDTSNPVRNLAIALAEWGWEVKGFGLSHGAAAREGNNK